jgi:hypothetical protein
MNKKLYTKVEDLIILWVNDGTKTAGHLTRQIMELLSDESTEISDRLDGYGSNEIEKKVNNRLEKVTEDRNIRWDL